MKTRSSTTTSPHSKLAFVPIPKRSKQPLQDIKLPSKRQKLQIDHAPICKSNDYDLIPFIPIVQLSVTDMIGSPIPLLRRLQNQYGQFGAVQLVCPVEWNPNMEFKHPKLSLTTRLQPLHSLKLGKSFEQKKEACSLTAFHDLATEFQRGYHMKFPEKGLTECSRIENEYWRLVQGADQEAEALCPKRYKVTVEYAADLSADRYGSGFPRTSSRRSRDEHFDYAENLFNLNNIYKSQDSLMGISEQRGQWIGGITIPWIYVGMMFSSFCWHVEDSGINSLNYSHCGQTKVWYVVPGGEKGKFDDFIEERIGQRAAMQKITYMIDPIELVQKGIKVYKAYQQPKHFICTFFNAYHCGFSQGFNIGQAINFVITQSLPLINVSRNTSKPSLFCYQWLIHQNYLRAKQKGNVCSILQREYRQILEEQQANIGKFMKKSKEVEVVIVEDKVRYTRYQCGKCKKYLFLSFASCSCGKNYCLPHSHSCCQQKQRIFVRRPKGERQKYILQLLPS